MASPNFLTRTSQLLAYRSAYICNSPDCNALTVGPSIKISTLALKVGEAAHIRGARNDSARFEEGMTNEERSHVDNGIWLCAHCHTLVDKNNGRDYSTKTLQQWKQTHENLISGLLRTHKSPLPLIQRHSSNFALAQDAIDTISSRGAFFQEHAWENPSYVVASIEQSRRRIERLRRDVEFDERLKSILSQAIDALRIYMNETSRSHHDARPQLHILRSRIAVILMNLRDEYGCKISGDITRILSQ